MLNIFNLHACDDDDDNNDNDNNNITITIVCQCISHDTFLCAMDSTVLTFPCLYFFHTYMLLLFRLRLSGKKKKKFNLHVKRPGAKKDEMKLALLKLKGFIQRDQTDGAALEAGPYMDTDSGSDRGSIGPGGVAINQSPLLGARHIED